MPQLTEDQRKIFIQKMQALKEQLSTMAASEQEELDKLKTAVNKLPDTVGNAIEEFDRETKLSFNDMAFVVFAATLQVGRQVLISKLNHRLKDQDAAKRTPGHTEEHSDKTYKKYYASIQEITTNPVPFDAIRKEKVVRLNGNPQLNGFNHRYVAVGHDPIMGLLFGTANIMTKTITINKGLMQFETYHVGSIIASNGSADYLVDSLTNQADTSLMFEKIYERFSDEGEKAWEALGLALFKEIIHLMSDIQTKKSLPLPFVSSVSPKCSRILNLCGIDALTFCTNVLEYKISKLINFIIAYIYALRYDPQKDGSEETYEAKTQKIIEYSNAISLVSNTVQTLYRVCVGDEEALLKFDFGGTFSSMKILWESPYIIDKIKAEYIEGKIVELFNY